MKKTISILLTLVLFVSMFTVLGSFTASAETIATGDVKLKLTFDGSEPYGIVGRRGGNYKYYPDKGYFNITQYGGAGDSYYFGVNGSVGQTIVNGMSDATPDEDRTTAYNNILKLQAGKTYQVKLDFRILKGSQYVDGRKLTLYAWTNPMTGVKGVNSTEISIEKRTTNCSVEGNVVDWHMDKLVTPEGSEKSELSEDMPWQTASFVFTVREDETDGICVGFSFSNIGAYKTYANIDNVIITEVENTFSYTENKLYTMDDQPTYTNASSISSSYVSDDEEHGTVLKLVGTATSSRGGYKNADFTVTKGNKYYITFEAKADVDSDAQLQLVLSRCDNRTGNSRHFIAGWNDSPKGVEVFINGEKVPMYVDSDTKETSQVPLSKEWQTYGLIIDTTDEELLKSIENYQATFWNNDIKFMFGVYGTAYFDNMQVTMASGIDCAVPEKNENSAHSIRATKTAAKNEGVFQSAGLRFRGTVSNVAKAEADEIGFVIAPSSAVADDDDWYDVKNGVNPVVKQGTWYVKGQNDSVYYAGEDDTYYQLILTNLSNAAGDNLYSRRFVAVMYVKTGDTYTYTSLGETSYNEVKAKYKVRNVAFDESGEELIEKSILMIGNSFCSYFTDELYGIARAEGYDLKVANLYYAGCYVKWHWEWLQEDTPNYILYVTDEEGRRETGVKTFQAALDFDDWDIISLQQHMSLSLMPEYETVWNSLDPYVENLYNHIRTNNPDAELYWQETWAHEVGFDGFGYTMPDAEYQATVAAVIKQASERVCEENNVPMIPSGDAWVIARTVDIIGDNLCQSATKNDKYHDGDVGGGQYLNACTWFEVLFGLSCVGNEYVPNYDLSAEKRAALQLSAHQAVAAIYGADYAK